MKITIVGHVCIDENTSEHAKYKGAGSPSMYMAKYFQTVPGLLVTIIAPYGNDFRQHSREVRLLPEALDAPTLVYKNITSNNSRIQYCEHADTAVPPQLTPEVVEVISSADIICVAPLLPNFDEPFVQNVLAKKNPHTVTVLLPQGYMRHINKTGVVEVRQFQEANALLPLFDIIALSEEDIPDVFRQAELWAGQSPRTNIIVTQGEKGASIVSSAGTQHVSTSPVAEEKIVDSVGCGDVFSAALMHEYYKSHDIVLAVKAGNKAARQKLFHAGV